MRLHDGDPTPVARPRDAAATRARLLRAAMRLFTVNGYDRTTTREIAAVAEVNVSLIARYFGSKDGLYAAVLEESAGSIDAGPSADLVGEILAGLRAEAWPEFGGEHPLTLLLRADTADPRTTALRRRALTTAVTRLTRQVAPGAAADDPEARVRGAAALAVVVGVTSLHAALPDTLFTPADDDAWRAVLTDLLTAAARRPGPS